MKVAMIVVNYNASQDVTSNIEKARRYDSIDRIVIVDNKSSREDELKYLKELENEKVIVIESDKNGGYAYGNNFGINYLNNSFSGVGYYSIINFYNGFAQGNNNLDYPGNKRRNLSISLMNKQFSKSRVNLKSSNNCPFLLFSFFVKR